MTFPELREIAELEVPHKWYNEMDDRTVYSTELNHKEYSLIFEWNQDPFSAHPYVIYVRLISDIGKEHSSSNPDGNESVIGKAS